MVLMACHFKIDQFSIDQLIYRGEGNSSLVVGIKSTCQVIRLLKSDAKKLRNANDVLTHLLQHIDFNENFLPDVIPEYLFSSPKLICLDQYQLDLIKNFVKDKRPSFRLDKTLSNCGYALLMTDYCSIPRSISYDWTSNSVIAVEIKPKQGFMPDADLFCSNDFLQIKSRICRFGLSQFYKLQKQSIKAISSYCPLDLFSGCPSRILYSLLCLIENPQNNFRVFLNSHLIFDDQSNIDNLKLILDNFLQGDTKKYQPNNFFINKETSFDSISSFGLLLLQILLKPLCEKEENSQSKIYQKGNKNDYKYVPNVLRELENLDSNEKYVFFRTFIQIFEKLSNNSNEIIPKNDMNNNQIYRLNIFIDLQLNLNFANDNFVKEIFSNHQNIRVNKSKIIDALMSVKTVSNSKCILHQNKRFKKLNSNLDFYCICKDSSKHRLPTGSILDSILNAQKLDTIDSFIAVEIFKKLYIKYKVLKQDLSTNCLYPCNGNPEMRKSLETFILKNIHDLDNLWRFLLSLTAKDCSIMIAMQRCMDPCDDLLYTATPCHDNQQVSTFSVNAVDKTTGYHYMGNVSIIDLDYKPASKIQRMLHNDSRMIYAFLNSLVNSIKTNVTNTTDNINSLPMQFLDIFNQDFD